MYRLECERRWRMIYGQARRLVEYMQGMVVSSVARCTRLRRLSNLENFPPEQFPFGLWQHHQYKSAELSKALAQSSQRLTRLHQDVPNVTNTSSDNPLRCIVDCPSSSPQQMKCQTIRSRFCALRRAIGRGYTNFKAILKSPGPKSRSICASQESRIHNRELPL